jgi:hypothetical protein
MLKKTVLLSSLILFSIPNTFYAQGDECEECMSQVVLGVSFCGIMCVVLSAGQNRELDVFRAPKPNPAPMPQRMGTDEDKKNK